MVAYIPPIEQTNKAQKVQTGLEAVCGLEDVIRAHSVTIRAREAALAERDRELVGRRSAGREKCRELARGLVVFGGCEAACQ
jgi:hypothetical protein